MKEINKDDLIRAERFRGYVIAMLEGINPEQLKEMIKTGQVPILLEFEVPDIISAIQPLIVKYRDIILPYLNTDKVMDYAVIYKPEFVAIFRHPKGMQWLDRFLKQIRFIVEHAELQSNEMRLLFYKTIKENKMRRLMEEEKIRAEQEKIQEEQQEIPNEPEPENINVPELPDIDKIETSTSKKIDYTDKKLTSDFIFDV